MAEVQRPPGPPNGYFGVNTFGINHVLALKRDMLGYYTELHEKYGDIVYLRLGPYHYYVIYHPEATRDVLVGQAKSFRMNPKIRHVLAQWNGNGLLLSEGEYWHRQRRLMQPTFSPKRFERYAEVMVGVTDQLADAWTKQSRGAGHVDLDVDRAMTALTLQIIGRTFFDADLTAEAEALGRSVALLSEVAVREMQQVYLPPKWLPYPGRRAKFAAIEHLDRTIRGFIRARRASGEDRGDLLSMLLQAVDTDGSGMTDEQARDECMTMFLAGHDTTAAGLAWTFYVLATEPSVAGKLQAELERVLGGRPPRFADLPSLAYTEMVVKEALRLYPPAIGVFMRQATENVVVGGYDIPRGGMVQPISFVTHRDPRWFPDPLRVDPERFAPGRVEQLPQFAYFPFGGGPRGCIGQTFAMTEMVLVVATLMQRFNAELAPDQGRVELQTHLSLRPAGGLRLRLRLRGNEKN